MNRAIGLGLAAALMALSGACGVPAQHEAHAVDLPRRPLTTPAPDVTAGRPGEVAEVLCLARDTHLVQVVRRIDTAPGVQQQLDHLLAGPTDAERNRGITTGLTGLTLRGALPRGSDEAQVEVTEADENNARSDESLAYGQIVCTLTSRAEVSSVVFTRDGERLEVPRADGSLSRGPLFSSDYAALIGPA
ncbi:GerMN domain-containing protein [Actinoplanes sp. N902-109]|uniref:GerMN domain-containing protein n=1 Tax=Actinoplanes sp. (strain N902-109) TaxID=649831 RepID=UPI0003A20115|nr:GerMN domain-containing protein [Actinoplanes sp. N902-109]